MSNSRAVDMGAGRWSHSFFPNWVTDLDKKRRVVGGFAVEYGEAERGVIPFSGDLGSRLPSSSKGSSSLSLSDARHDTHLPTYVRRYASLIEVFTKTLPSKTSLVGLSQQGLA
jgi:hypothetical protein